MGFDYFIEWEDVNDFVVNGFFLGNNFIIVIFFVVGIYCIYISGNFMSIRFNNLGDC